MPQTAFSDAASSMAVPGRCVMVLGMHRSGTSMLAGTLAAAGVRLGRVLEAPFALNPTGLREPEVLIHLHEDLLHANGGAWHDPPEGVTWGALHRSVRDLFIEARARPGLWGFKEPRTLLLAEGWIEALADWTAVGIFRHPAAVAASLAHRNGFDHARGVRLWTAYNRRLLALQRAHGFPLLEFEADPLRMRAGLVRVLEGLGCDARAADRVHDATLPRHDRAAGQGMDAGLDTAAAELLTALRGAAAAQGANGAAGAAAAPAPEPAELHSTRLFPRHRGVAAYVPTGIAARCDWLVLSDPQPPHTGLRRHRGEGAPRHVFLSLREPFLGLRFFVQEVLPQIAAPFVLVSGSEDATVPRQLDRRWRPFDAAERGMIRDLLADPRLICWFAENLDAAAHAKLRPLPLGMVWPDATVSGAVPSARPLGPRPVRALCAHRQRPGPQWAARRQVDALARGPWVDFVTHPGADLSEAAFAAALSAHSFVLCVEGGGLDPAPKAWMALLHGAIPIIRDTPVAAAYRRLPVVVVPDWRPDVLSPTRLQTWKTVLQPQFDDPMRRAAVLQKLRLDYWWDCIRSRARPDSPG